MRIEDVPAWPQVTATLDGDGNGEVVVNGTSHPVTASTLDEGRATARAIADAQAADRLGRPVRMSCVDPDGAWLLIVHPGGEVEDHTPARRRKRAVTPPPPPPPSAPAAPDVDLDQPTSTDLSPTAQAFVALAQEPSTPTEQAPTAPIVWGTPAPTPVVTAEPAPPTPAPQPAPVAVDPIAELEATTTPPNAAVVSATEAPAPATEAHAPATSFVRQPPPVPELGMRSLIYKLTGLNAGPSSAEEYLNGLLGRIRARLEGTHNITTLCLKGGIAKTTTSLGLALTLARYRADQVLGMDMNPDAGDLADRALSHAHVEAMSPRTVTDVLRAIRADTIHDLTELNRYTLTSDRLHLIAGEQTPEVSTSITTADYLAIRDVVDRFYPLTITDCGTGVTHPAMRGILDRADQVIVSAGWAVSGATRAERTLDWLAAQESYQGLAERAVVVLSESTRVSRNIDRAQITAQLKDKCRSVHLVPFDPVLSLGDHVSLPALARRTRAAYIELAATVVDGLV